ncbi:MerR family transcriptional regulator [Clostridium paraputrificum]|uniref:MerR family transcriptional regulator n=1 Tax=Clostridium TaxID=1485 RepID=UPI003D345A9D
MRAKEVEGLLELPIKTIKYYEEEGLITPKRNSSNGYRDYSEEDIKILKEIKLLRKLGFSILQIKRVLNKAEDIVDVFEEHIGELDNTIESLDRAKIICSHILEDSDINFGDYLEKVSSMERDGYKFMEENIKEKEFNKKSKITNWLLVGYAIFAISGMIFASKEASKLRWVMVILIFAGMLLLVYRHQITTGYICSFCEKRFSIGFIEDLISPQNSGKKYVKCPYCKNRTWASESYKD